MGVKATCPRCGAGKASAQLFACKSCWFDLPRVVRAAIGHAYRRHGAMTAPWCDAAAEAFKAWGMEPPRWLQVLREADLEAGVR